MNTPTKPRIGPAIREIRRRSDGTQADAAARPGEPLLPSRIGLLASLCVGTLFAFLFPPFTVADEPAHFYRAYLLSEGRPLVSIVDGRAGALLPESLAEAAQTCIEGLVRREEVRFSSGRWLAAWSIELESERRAFLEFPNSGMLPFVPYVPQALAIAVGRMLELPPVALVYLGRLGNLLVGSWLVWLALRRIPGWRWPALFLALNPAALGARASLSPDALVFALTLCIVAATLAGLADRQRPSAAETGSTLALATIALCLTKLPYAPLLFAVLPVYLSRPHRLRLSMLGIWVLLLTAAISYSSWCVARVTQPLRTDVVIDREGQLVRALTEPSHFLRSTIKVLRSRGRLYVEQLWGDRLGWLDVPLPTGLPWLLGAAFLALVFLDRPPGHRPNPAYAAAFAAATVASLLTVALSQYATWTPPNVQMIRGLQGRYFLPLMPFVLGTLASLPPVPTARLRSSEMAMPVALATMLLSLVATSAAVYQRYWGP